jgi:protein TonB
VRAWLPYLSSAVAHGGLLATLHWACQGPAPAQYALQAGHAQIELLMSMPRDPAETPAVQITERVPPAEPMPVAALERRQVELPPRPVETVEATLLDARADVVAAPPPAVSPAEQSPADAPPPQPVERQPTERALTAATPAAYQTPAAVGATVDELPKKLPRNPAPQYPAAAYTAGQEGVVLVRVQVSAEGAVADVRLEESCGFALLDQSALATVRHWRFSPARRAGLAVAHEILVPVRFQLAARRPA